MYSCYRTGVTQLVVVRLAGLIRCPSIRSFCSICFRRILEAEEAKVVILRQAARRSESILSLFNILLRILEAEEAKVVVLT